MDSYNQKAKNDLSTRVNERIRVPKVLVIDNKGENIGEVDTLEAIRMAKEVGLDLVEVSPNAKPPVCRIMDFSKYIYEQKKKLRKNKSGKAKDLKEFKFSPVIDVGDKNTRVRRAKEFLDKDHPVKITIQKRGRQPYEQMKEVFADILTNFTEYSTIEAEPKGSSNSISITFKKNVTSKNKQNSNQENQALQPERKQESKDDVQTESSGSPKDQKILKIKKTTE